MVLVRWRWHWSRHPALRVLSVCNGRLSHKRVTTGMVLGVSYIGFIHAHSIYEVNSLMILLWILEITAAYPSPLSLHSHIIGGRNAKKCHTRNVLAPYAMWYVDIAYKAKMVSMQQWISSQTRVNLGSRTKYVCTWAAQVVAKQTRYRNIIWLDLIGASNAYRSVQVCDFRGGCLLKDRSLKHLRPSTSTCIIITSNCIQSPRPSMPQRPFLATDQAASSCNLLPRNVDRHQVLRNQPWQLLLSRWLVILCVFLRI